MTKVSVIVPCYNQAQYLSDALETVYEQTYKEWECIIVNDGSIDNTKEVAQAWLAKDSRFKYIEKENGGLSSARNAGILISQGNYILPLDADDKIGTEYLKLAINQFNENNQIKIVYCNAEKFGFETGTWNLPDFTIKELALNNMIFCSALFKKRDWERVGGYDIKMIHGLEDWEFWISLLKDGGLVKKIDEFCFFYRVKKNSMIQTLINDQNKLVEMMNYISVKHADFMVKQLGSFMHLNDLLLQSEIKHKKQLTNKKFVLGLFMDTFIRYIKEKISLK